MKAERIVRIIGVVLILYSLFRLSSDAILTVGILSKVKVLKLNPSYKDFSNLFQLPYIAMLGSTIYSIIVAITGIGLIKFRFWAKDALLFISLLLFTGTLRHLFTFGLIGLNTYIPPWDALILIFLYILLVAIKFKKLFPIQKEKEKKIKQARIWIILIVAIFALFTSSFGYFKNLEFSRRGIDVFYKPKRMNLIAATKPSNGSYTKHQIGILRLSLPPDYRITQLMKSDSNYVLGIKDNASQVLALIYTNDNFFSNNLKPMYTVFRYNDAYEFGRHFIREKWGFVFLQFKSFSEKGRFDEIESDTWKGFVYNDAKPYARVCCGKKEKVRYYVFDIFVKKELLPFEFAFMLPEGNKDLKNIADNIIASLKFTETDLNNLQSLYAKGLEQLKNNELEDAKDTFVSCLLKDYGKPEYHFCLAKAFKESGDFISARHHLQETLKIDPKNIEAENLLNSIPKEGEECK